MTAINPNTNAERGNDHPCRMRYENIIDFQEDLAILLNTVQKHTECSTDYCLKYNKKEKRYKCRFGFPIENMQSKASYDKSDSGDVEYYPARNDDRLNKYNEFIIQLWRANMDIAPVISKKRLLAYLTKYISKCEVSSNSMEDLMMNITEKLNDDSKARQAIQRFFIKSCVERDVSAQEVCHTLLGLKLHSSGNRNFVIVNFGASKWIQLMNSENNFRQECDDNCNNGKSFIEKYKDRPAIMNNVSLWDAAKNYNSRKWTLLPHNAHNIVRVFPRLKCAKNDDENDKFYEQQVFLHVPWRDETTIKLPDESWQEVYKKHNIQDTNQDLLENVVLDTTDDDDDDNDDGILYEHDYHQEWMVLSRSGPKNLMNEVELGKRYEDLEYPWMDSFKNYEQFGTIEQFQTFIQSQKRKETVKIH